jgi:ADP-ribosylglycohydrolase
MSSLAEKIHGAIVGGAIGDAMGAPVEGRTAVNIAEIARGHDYNTFLPPVGHKPGEFPSGKGDGRITDDTLMIEVLVKAYAQKRDHLDAYDYEKIMCPMIRGITAWVPEYQKDMNLWDRFSGAEQIPWLRLRMNQEPRSGGLGNNVNCGFAMWALPIGAANAGDPFSAYGEAVLLGMAHNMSFGLEAGAVMAAMAAAAFAPGTTQDAVFAAGMDLAKDGTHNALRATLAAANPADDLPTFIRRVREAFVPYDPKTLPPGYVADGEITDNGMPSRIRSIEELPVAAAALKYGGGDFLKTIRAAVEYGRDCDSIAGMACGLFGALYGVAKIPASLRTAVDAANRRDFAKLAKDFYAVVQDIHAKDAARFDARSKAIKN